MAILSLPPWQKPLKTLYVGTHRDELRQIKEERNPLQQDALRVQVQG
ncbi:DUF6026 family protein [Pseudomonas karstica]|nr:DUF6026 family protein [Pseudomonas karstica]